MVVDDEQDITAALKQGLEKKGMSVAIFNDPLLALEELKNSHGYDLVITDVRMPTMSGFELYREIQKHDGGVAVCFLTAFDIYLKEFEQVFPDIHPRAIIKKPITISNLAAQIDRLIGVHEEGLRKELA